MGEYGHVFWKFFNNEEFERKTPKDEVNHVKLNRQLSSKINLISDIQLFHRNYLKEKDQQVKKKFQDEVDFVQRQFSVNDGKRWQDFKIRKNKAV